MDSKTWKFVKNMVDPYDTLLGAIVGAVISFFLLIVWDSRKDAKLDRENRLRILTLLAIEAGENVTRAVEIQTMLTEEITLAGLGKLYIASPPRLLSDGWTIAKASNVLKYVGEANLKKWSSAYANLAMVNSNLEGRELFKATSGAMSNYTNQIQTFDYVILRGIAIFVLRAKEALDTLPSEITLSRDAVILRKTPSENAPPANAP